MEQQPLVEMFFQVFQVLPFLPVPFKPKISSTKGKSSLERMKKAPLSWLLIFPDSFSPIPCCSAAVKFVVSAVRITPALLKLRFLTIHQASGEAGRDPSTPKPPPNSCLGKKKIKKKKSAWRRWDLLPGFSRVFVVSQLAGEGVEGGLQCGVEWG